MKEKHIETLKSYAKGLNDYEFPNEYPYFAIEGCIEEFGREEFAELVHFYIENKLGIKLNK